METSARVELSGLELALGLGAGGAAVVVGVCMRASTGVELLGMFAFLAVWFGCVVGGMVANSYTRELSGLSCGNWLSFGLGLGVGVGLGLLGCWWLGYAVAWFGVGFLGLCSVGMTVWWM